MMMIMNPNKASQQSCSMWTIYLVLEIVVTLKKIQRVRKNTSSSSSMGRDDPTQAQLTWKLVRTCLFLPNAIHWTIGHVLPEHIVSLLGGIEAIISLAVV